MPKEVWKTKTQTFLANTPAFSPPSPYTTLVGACEAPNPSQLSSRQPRPWPPLGASPICQSAPAQSAHTRIFFLLFETKPHPCILSEPAIYFPLNVQMPIQSKLVPRQLARCTSCCEQQVQTHNMGYVHVFWEVSASKPTSLAVLKLGGSFLTWS